MSNTPTFGASNRPLAVVTTVTPWHEPPRIRHQLTRQLCRFYNVLYVELKFGPGSKTGASYERVTERLVVLSLKGMPRGFGRLWENVAAVHRLYNLYLVAKVEAAVRRMHGKRAILVNFQHNFPEIMSSPVFKSRVYVCNDEFPLRQTNARKRARLVRYEEAVVRGADLCLAVSYPLLDKLSAITDKAHLLLPGHEFAAAATTAVAGRSGQNCIAVAFMGYINHRLCFDWLQALLVDPAIRLTLIGPIQDESAVSALRQHANFRHVPPLEGSALKQELEHHDVLVMPYDTRQAGVRAASAPNKLFQYLACAKPIVISDMPQFARLPDKFIYRATDAQSFLRAVHRAFEDDDQPARAARLAYAADNTWDVRGDQMHRLLSALPAEED